MESVFVVMGFNDRTLAVFKNKKDAEDFVSRVILTDIKGESTPRPKIKEFLVL